MSECIHFPSGVDGDDLTYLNTYLPTYLLTTIFPKESPDRSSPGYLWLFGGAVRSFVRSYVRSFLDSETMCSV